MPSRFISDDYVTVNERIIAFKNEYPEGSLQSELIDLSESRVVMRGLAYRTPDDVRPGIGHSWLEIPGKTPFTRGSEIENCETSAWGRALAALGFEVKRGIATAEEVAMKHGKEDNGEVEITESEIPGVERGGRTKEANKIQIRQALLLSRELGLGVKGFGDAIEEILGQIVLMPDDEKMASDILLAFLEELSRDDIGKLITGLKQRVEPVATDAS